MDLPLDIQIAHEATSSGFGVASDVSARRPEGNGPHSPGEQSSLQGGQIGREGRLAHAITNMADIIKESFAGMWLEIDTLKSENRALKSQLKVIQTQMEAIRTEFEKSCAEITSGIRVMRTEAQGTNSVIGSLKFGRKRLEDSRKPLKAFVNDHMEYRQAKSEALDEGTGLDVPRAPSPPRTNEPSISRQTLFENAANAEDTPLLFNQGLQGTSSNRPPPPQSVSGAVMTPYISRNTPWQKHTTTSTLHHPNTQGHPHVRKENIHVSHHSTPVAQMQGGLSADTSGGLATNAGPQSLHNSPYSVIPLLRRRRFLIPRTTEGSRKKPRH